MILKTYDEFAAHLKSGQLIFRSGQGYYLAYYLEGNRLTLCDFNYQHNTESMYSVCGLYNVYRSCPSEFTFKSSNKSRRYSC